DRTAHFSLAAATVKPAPADSFSRVKIAIDSRALLAERTGIGTYTLAIARGLAARPGTRIGLFAPRPLARTLEGAEAFSLHTDHHPFGILWLQTTLPQRLARWEADVLV